MKIQGDIETSSALINVNATLNTAYITNNFILPKTSGFGIKLDSAAPTFGWKDLLGAIRLRNSVGPDPAPAVYRGTIRQAQFTQSTDEVMVEFHLPHDFVPGSEMYIHAHWSHIIANAASGGVVWGFETSYAKGYDQEQFIAPITILATMTAPTGASGQYRHEIAEVQLSSPTMTVTLLNSALTEIDGLVLVRIFLSANTISPAADPFLHFVDLHYQSTQTATKTKNYPFYT